MKGFQQTDIGLFPVDWRLSKIDDVFTLQQGKSISAKERTGTFLKPFLRTSNVFWGRIDLANVDEMDIPLKDRDRLVLQYGDVLVCEGGDIGRTAIWRNELVECYYQNHLHRLRPRGNEVNAFFFARWMEAAFLTMQLFAGEGNRTTIPNLSGSRLKEFAVPLPSLPEQKKIAAVLSKLQKAIAVQEQLIQSLRDLKKSTTKHLFRYGLKGESLKKTDIGIMPLSWAVSNLVDAVEQIDYGYSISIPEAADESGIGIVSTADMTKYGKLLYWKIRKIAAPERTILRLTLQDGDLLFNWRNSPELVGKSCIYRRQDEPHIFASFILRIKCGTKSHNQYLCYLLNHLREEGVFVQLARRAVNQANYNKNEISVLPIRCPPLSEQVEIAHILQAIDIKLENHELQKASYQALFKTMLNKLMTGQIRVKDLDIDTTEVDAA